MKFDYLFLLKFLIKLIMSSRSKNYDVYFYGLFCHAFISYKYYISRLTLLRKGLSLTKAKKYVEMCTEAASLLTHFDFGHGRNEHWRDNINHNVLYGVYFYTKTQSSDFVTFGEFDNLSGVTINYPLGNLPKDILPQIKNVFTDLNKLKKKYKDCDVTKPDETEVFMDKEKGFDFVPISYDDLIDGDVGLCHYEEILKQSKNFDIVLHKGFKEVLAGHLEDI